MRTITVALDISKAFDTINIHTQIRNRYTPTFQAQSWSSSQTTSRDAKHTQHTETTHPYNFILKLTFLEVTFLKVASSQPHYLTFTLQTYHHPKQRLRSCLTQMTSPLHLHTQARVQPRNTYNHTYIKVLPGQNITTSTKSRQNNPRSCGI